MSNISHFQGNVLGAWRPNSRGGMSLFKLVADNGKSLAVAKYDKLDTKAPKGRKVLGYV